MAIPDVKLNSKTKIPQIGLGTWLMKNEKECKQAINYALTAGYRHFDTAQIYENESFIGDALKQSKINRSELFITTKIWNDNMFWDDLPESLAESLEKLQTDYVDLLLLHFPVTDLRRPAWRQMERQFKEGKAKSIGVSNYTIKHLKELLKEGSVKPAVNQVEIHVFLEQPELIRYCRTQGIVVEAYSPLAHGEGLDDPVLVEVAKKHNKTPAQIMIRWCVEKGFVALPKSVHRERIKENFDVFDFKLDRDDMRQLSKLDRDYRTCWDPTHVQ